MRKIKKSFLPMVDAGQFVLHEDDEGDKYWHGVDDGREINLRPGQNFSASPKNWPLGTTIEIQVPEEEEE